MRRRRASLEFRGSVAVITLTDPKRRNAIGLEMAEDIVAACAEIESRRCGVAVIRGAGDYFCSGADRFVLDEAARAPTQRDATRLLDTIYQSFTSVGNLNVPVIAAVRGGAIGAGLNLALSADIRVVADDAILASGFRRIGLHQGGGHGYLVSRLAGPEVAMAMIVFGEAVTGTRAHHLGMAWASVKDVGVEPEAFRLAAVAASDSDLSRAMVGTLRGRHTAAWRGWVRRESTAQVWSLRRAVQDDVS